jgi:hypothetical protein
MRRPSGDEEPLIGSLRRADNGESPPHQQNLAGELVGDEVCSGDLACGKVAVNQQLLTVFVDCSEIDAGNLLENVETTGRVTESGADSRSMKVFDGELGKGSAKLRERFVERKRAFSGLDSMKTSRSLVMRGCA